MVSFSPSGLGVSLVFLLSDKTHLTYHRVMKILELFPAVDGDFGTYTFADSLTAKFSPQHILTMGSCL